ncbi:MAG: hypothetical protein QNL62_22835 [Gammaproteobacteria bacterium]|nr:hypothetical protein [Gammaproteobacteria bacterium]
MKYRNIILFTALLSASLFTPVAFAADAQKDNFDARIEQMNKRLEADRAQWEKRKNMSFEERRAQDDARWAEIEKQYNAELVAGKKRYEAIKAEMEKRKDMSFEELRAQDDARWAEREKQYKAAEAKMGKKQ